MSYVAVTGGAAQRRYWAFYEAIRILRVEDYFATLDADGFKHRLVALSLCVAGVFVVLFARLFFLQVVEGEEYRRLSENNCIRLQRIEPPRGQIFDRNGVNIVDNRPSFDLSIIPKDAGDTGAIIERLVTLIGIPAARLHGNFVKHKTVNPYKPVLLAQDVGRDVLAVVEGHRFDLPGVVMNVTPRRHYLYNGLAAHLIGYLGEISRGELDSDRFAGYEPGSYVGKYGAERLYEPFLRGRYGGRQVEVNAGGNVVRVLKTVEAESGHHVYLTLDFGLQQKAEALMAGVSGAAIALDPATGAVLAMVSSPSFPQSRFVDGMSAEEWQALVTDPRRPMENKAIQAEYPPASVYKIITSFAGLEEDVVAPDTTFYCPGYYRYGDRVYRCWAEQGHGRVSLVDALARSCDVYYYQVGQRVGVERLAWYAKACGLGRPTGIDLYPEKGGLVPSGQWKRRRLGTAWQGGETLSVAIGQSYNLVTPLQMAVLTAAVANGGVLKRPVILDRVETVEKEWLKEGEPRDMGMLPVSESTLELVRQGMWKAVNDRHGTAWWSARSRKMEISGKTGTAQVVASPRNGDEEIYAVDTHKPHAWFVAYAPSENPIIAVAVIVEHGEHGSSAAGPVAKAMIETYVSARSGNTDGR